ncbi:hypothetical protein CAOG_00126 [Capsaspora owczarzaki ATCC 30864]|uniref:J domain-containing protein n=1 Tax=Capsaspora owczarzaki (strain ATCC 30864) TaxID=595528 RepID=A0A0D2TZW9_CAPO3|nr:hypothetical protein CAOG_00126 [Capsaspora owczarzaki ATCC 30864]KJE88471.1 hypothetical protein CAOG_000126 [Capsaspora owczarzaki ATCC 30864]|eukprot:XP_004364997.2 hypothetical protein CAOG_00126 [Capsaspora owczarzaki ATCC 30864]
MGSENASPTLSLLISRCSADSHPETQATCIESSKQSHTALKTNENKHQSSAMTESDMLKEDLYKLLNVEPTATEKEIAKAYRVGALKCHPDKNPDNPAAHELFQRLSRAYEILGDEKARQAYDGLLTARNVNKARVSAMNDRQRELRADLERRESEASARRAAAAAAGAAENGGAANKRPRMDEDHLRAQLAHEIERLRKDGMRRLQEEQEKMRRTIEEERKQATHAAYAFTSEAQPMQQHDAQSASASVVIRWNPSADPPLTEDTLREMLGACGGLDTLLTSKNPGSAVASFASLEGAARALAAATNLSNAPIGADLKLKIILKEDSGAPADQAELVAALVQRHRAFRFPQMAGRQSDSSLRRSTQTPIPADATEYERVTLLRMREAQERRRLQHAHS